MQSVLIGRPRGKGQKQKLGEPKTTQGTRSQSPSPQTQGGIPEAESRSQPSQDSRIRDQITEFPRVQNPEAEPSQVRSQKAKAQDPKKHMTANLHTQLLTGLQSPTTGGLKWGGCSPQQPIRSPNNGQLVHQLEPVEDLASWAISPGWVAYQRPSHCPTMAKLLCLSLLIFFQSKIAPLGNVPLFLFFSLSFFLYFFPLHTIGQSRPQPTKTLVSQDEFVYNSATLPYCNNYPFLSDSLVYSCTRFL